MALLVALTGCTTQDASGQGIRCVEDGTRTIAIFQTAGPTLSRVRLSLDGCDFVVPPQTGRMSYNLPWLNPTSLLRAGRRNAQPQMALGTQLTHAVSAVGATSLTARSTGHSNSYAQV